MSDGSALTLSGIRRAFRQGGSVLRVLKGISLSITPGEIVALVGPSGAGKSTLLHIAGLLEKADEGEVRIAGQPCGRMSDQARTRIRRAALGFVYQSHHLLPEFSALENVVMPLLIAGRSKRQAQERAESLLTDLGLAERLTHRPGRLSGGEQQRVAIARAMANEPAVLLADEPTGNLDPKTADLVFDEMLGLAKRTRLAALVATHNPDLAARMDRIVELRDGLIVPA
jgi:lipoprotein-releasing system ATP-binding protein